MEINLGNNFGGNIGVRNETMNVNDIGGKTSDTSHVSRSSSNLIIEKGVDALAAAEPTAEVPESELTRDDELGKLVSSAFALQAPPMPDFT